MLSRSSPAPSADHSNRTASNRRVATCRLRCFLCTQMQLAPAVVGTGVWLVAVWTFTTESTLCAIFATRPPRMPTQAHAHVAARIQ